MSDMNEIVIFLKPNSRVEVYFSAEMNRLKMLLQKC